MSIATFLAEMKASRTELKANIYLGGCYAIDKVRPNGNRVAHVADVYGIGAETTARMFAAAPELLEALEEAQWGGERLTCPSCGCRLSHNADCTVAAALRKARGENV